MKLFVYSFVFSINLVPVFANPIEFQLQNRLNPFLYDGCSGFPDSFGAYNWSDCCFEHDVSYWQGGTLQQKQAADNQLSKCVAEKTNQGFGNIIWLGVQLGGSASLPTTWRWGYGWNINRGYRALNSDEQIEVVSKLESISL